jgi:cold-inducible RNA-binding protein
MVETTTTQEPAPKRRRVANSNPTVAGSTIETVEKPLKQDSASTTRTNTKKATTVPPSSSSSSSTDSSKVYVGNLHVRVQQVHLEKLLQPYGTVVNIHVCYNKETGRPRGYAFCQFANAKQAEAAMAALHGRKLLGKSLVVQSAKPEGSTTTTTTTTTVSGKTSKGSDSQKLADKIEKLKQALKNETK